MKRKLYDTKDGSTGGVRGDVWGNVVGHLQGGDFAFFVGGTGLVGSRRCLGGAFGFGGRGDRRLRDFPPLASECELGGGWQEKAEQSSLKFFWTGP